MSLYFPKRKDVKLSNSPLIEVIAQIRFPTILKIAEKQPSDFQEAVRARFPEFEIEQGIRIGIDIQDQKPPVAQAKPRSYKFISMDSQNLITLAIDFVALTTKNYEHWRSFNKDLQLAYKAIQDIYKPSYASRIGLRYINELTLGGMNLETMEEMCNILRPELTSSLRSEGWSNPEEMINRLSLKDGGDKFTITTGYKQDAQTFLLDFDMYSEGKTHFKGIIKTYQRYHDKIYDAFRWCIMDENLSVFNPQKLEKKETK